MLTVDPHPHHNIIPSISRSDICLFFVLHLFVIHKLYIHFTNNVHCIYLLTTAIFACDFSIQILKQTKPLLLHVSYLIAMLVNYRYI